MQIWEGNSSYHSFQFQATRRYAHGVRYGVNYTMKAWITQATTST